MTNHEIAQVFAQIASLLAIKGESRFRIIAYERAAETIENLGRELSDIEQAGELQDIPGVGEAIASKIEELLATGELTYFQNLQQEVPLTLVDVMKVNGVGPKKAALFWKELGINDLEELQAAAEDGRLADLPGMGERSQERILEGIASLRRHQTGRRLLGEALPAADAILENLRSLPEVEQAEAAGSLRRRRETIGDLDLLVASDSPEPVMDRFVNGGEVNEIRGQGQTKSSVVLKNGLRVQLWVHPPDRFGSALQYATGSKEHNVRLRELAQQNGLSLSEHGYKTEAGEEILCKTEREVYGALDLPWIPPELREDRGEIEAAQTQDLPHLIELDDLRGDLHAHSDWSDGRATIEQMVRGAIELGYDYLVISDHSRSLGVANGLSVERLREQRKVIDDLQQQVGDAIYLLQGSEVEILADGTLDFPDEVLAELDLVVASLHTSLKQPRDVITERLLNAVRNPHVDIIGHPTGRLIGRRDPGDLDMDRIFAAAAEYGTALEINASPERLDLKDVHARRAVGLGCLLTIDTDAHHPDQYRLLKYGVATARRGWVEAESVVNTWSLERLLSWLEGRG
ncbi:MAG: DNA polymerase/3'-5' exonuclease PolX [Anaerolineales bacterium]